MAIKLPPIPNNPITDVFVWRDWFYKVSQVLVAQASTNFVDLNFSGSNLQSIETRQHNALQSIQGGQGGQYYHLTAAEYSSIGTLTNVHNNLTGLQGGISGQYYHLTSAQYTKLTNIDYGAFHYDYTTSLTSAITNIQTTIPVVSTTGFSSTGDIIIDDEIIAYTGITSNSFTGCTRGVHGSSSSSHVINSAVGGAQGLAANTVGTLMLNTTDLSNGVTLNTSTSVMTVASAGIYNLQFSVQLANAGNTQDYAAVWFQHNGSDISSSTSWATVPSKSGSTTGSTIMTVNIFYTLGAGDTVNLQWLSKNGNSVVVTYPGSTSPTYPSAPAVIFTVNRVS